MKPHFIQNFPFQVNNPTKLTCLYSLAPSSLSTSPSRFLFLHTASSIFGSYLGFLYFILMTIWTFGKRNTEWEREKLAGRDYKIRFFMSWPWRGGLLQRGKVAVLTLLPHILRVRQIFHPCQNPLGLFLKCRLLSPHSTAVVVQYQPYRGSPGFCKLNKTPRGFCAHSHWTAPGLKSWT